MRESKAKNKNKKIKKMLDLFIKKCYNYIVNKKSNSNYVQTFLSNLKHKAQVKLMDALIEAFKVGKKSLNKKLKNI